MRTIYLVRHGQSTWNRQRRLQGQTAHPPLTEFGRQEARAAAEKLTAQPGTGRATLWTSDLVRARQTAQIIGDRLDIQVRESIALREQALGDLEGLGYAELRAQSTPPGADVSEIRWGAGESVRDVHVRLTCFLGDLAAGVHILVSHGDAIRVALAVLDGRGHREVDWTGSIPNGGVRHRRCE